MEALSTLRYWEDHGLGDAGNIAEWRAILEMEDMDAAARAILEPGEAGERRRKNTPFGPFALTYNPAQSGPSKADP